MTHQLKKAISARHTVPYNIASYYFSHVSQNTQTKTQEWAVDYLLGLGHNLIGLNTLHKSMPGYVLDKGTAN